MDEIIWYSFPELLPDNGASFQVILRMRNKRGDIAERCIRCFQPGDRIGIGVIIPKSHKVRHNDKSM